MSEMLKKVRKGLFREYKHGYQQLFGTKEERKNILFVIGCQRSGTTMVTKIFEKDFSARVYQEVSKLSTLHRTRRKLNPFPMVEKEFLNKKVKTIISKPLVETQNIDKLFDYFPEAKALWMYRNYRDVASSDLKKFGIRNGINNIRPIVNKTEDNWRCERTSDETYQIIKGFFSEDMSPYDAAALFWYSRNILFFERDLDQSSRVRMCNYRELVTSPKETLQSVYAFLGADFPNEKLVSEVHSGSIRKGKDLKLSPEIELLCETLLKRLDEVYAKQENLSYKA